jgi:L-ascorbate metabolism protein UlaG (beta-lactamase superfamily)
MKINKLGHCCLVIEEQGLVILTDPGAFSTEQNKVTGIDVVFITHEHQDHFHIDSLKEVLKNNPTAIVVTNSAVGALLDKESIPYQILEHGNSQKCKNVLVKAFGEKHAIVYPSIPPVQNTGYLIADRFFFGGDALTVPGKPVEILALPVAGPWLDTQMCVDYAKQLHPKVVFPVHDGFLNNLGGFYHSIPKMLLEPEGIQFVILENGKVMEF